MDHLSELTSDWRLGLGGLSALARCNGGAASWELLLMAVAREGEKKEKVRGKERLPILKSNFDKIMILLLCSLNHNFHTVTLI